MESREELIKEFHELFEKVKIRRDDLVKEGKVNKKDLEEIEDLVKHGQNIENSLNSGEGEKIVATDEKIKRFIDKAKEYFDRR